MGTRYTIGRRTDGDFDEIVEAVTDELAAEGFGILCDIDVGATIEAKLGESFRRYRILGACNPELAFDGLNEELELGALLPCNVIVFETDDGSIGVDAVDPHAMVGLVGNPALDPIADDAADRLGRAIDRVIDAEIGSMDR